MGLLASSKLAPAAWEALASCMACAMTLRDTAAGVGVSLSTARFMRQRACEALGHPLEPFASGGGVEAQVDGAPVPESAKGRHRSGFPLPREPRRRGGQVSMRGVSSERMNVICGADDRGGVFLGLAGRGRCTDGQIKEAVGAHVRPGTAVAADGHPAYGRVLPGMGASHGAFESGTPEASRRLASVNSLHPRLKAFLGRFRGVSTRRLPGYLAWFAWREQTSIGPSDIARFLFGKVCEGRYSTTRREVWRVPFPFVGYWGVSGVV